MSGEAFGRSRFAAVPLCGRRLGSAFRDIAATVSVTRHPVPPAPWEWHRGTRASAYGAKRPCRALKDRAPSVVPLSGAVIPPEADDDERQSRSYRGFQRLQGCRPVAQSFAGPVHPRPGSFFATCIRRGDHQDQDGFGAVRCLASSCCQPTIRAMHEPNSA